MMSFRKTQVPGATVDSLMAFCLVLIAVLWSNLHKISSGGMADFIEMRLTLANASFSIIFTILWSRCFETVRVYRHGGSAVRVLLVSISGSALMTSLLWAYLIAKHAEGPVSRIVSSFFVVSLVYQALLGIVGFVLRRRHSEMERVIIVGSGRLAGNAWREVRTKYHGRKNLLGFFDDRHPDAMPPDIAGRYLGPLSGLSDYLLRNAVDELIVAMPLRSCYEMTQRAVTLAEAAGVRVSCLNDLYSLMHHHRLRRRAETLIELVPKDERHLVAERYKRVVDIVGSAFGLVVLSPVFLVTALLVKLTSRGPVFFVQERYGYRRRRFHMWKFRSMVEDAPNLMAALEAKNEAAGPIFKMKDDPRVTPLGRFLRKTSIDELPQLWNVFCGDMSLVGPRPMSVRDVSLFRQAPLMRRFSVRPGITGIWQVSGRSSLTFEQWIALDFNYIDDWSLGLDFQILARTVSAVLKRSGAV